MLEKIFASTAALGAIDAVGRAADWRLPQPILRPVIHAYGAVVGVDMDAVREPPGGFPTFGDFFARRLRFDLRPVCEDPDAMVSPCDGEVTSAGALDESGETNLAVKGRTWSAGDVVGGPESAAKFAGGGFAVIYLHPRDYHRVHVPFDGRVRRVRHVPGSRFPVAPWAEAQVGETVDRNERVAFELDLKGGGRAAVTMVAAFGVGNIDTRLGPSRARMRRNEVTEIDFDPGVDLKRGEEIGAFRLGSTVVVLWSRGAATMDEGWTGRRVEIGARIGGVATGSVENEIAKQR